MPRGWPPLEVREVEAILRALNFSYSHTSGGHYFWKGVRGGQNCTVTVDSHLAPFGAYLVRMMASQARCSRHEFYGATPGTAAKIAKAKNP